MENEYKFINNIQTHLITWGDPFTCDSKDVIICITGNPGVPDFYEEFGSALHETTRFAVCVIGQAGHEDVPDKGSNVLRNQENLFNLEGQINHKIELINNFIDKQNKLHLIGHSIGAWLLIEILHKECNIISRVKSVNLLFPTIQRMALTKNGYYLNNFIRHLHMFIILCITLVYLLPESIRLFLVNIYLKLNSLPPHYAKRILKYGNPKVIEKVLFLAYDEMDSVKLLNIDGINAIKHLTNVIYSVKDHWAPKSYMDDLEVFKPNLQMRQVDIDHSFVLRSSEQVAELVAQFIKSKCE